MKLSIKTPIETINKAYLKSNIKLNEYEVFKYQLKLFFENIKNALSTKETEEHYKNLLFNFLNDSFYRNKNYINTKSYKGLHEADLVIHSDIKSNSPVSVIFEVKNPDNKTEMITIENIHKKGFYESILYYLNEKEKGNNEVKYIVVSNMIEWFIFDATLFYKYFFGNKKLINTFRKWKNRITDGHSTKLMYEAIEKIVFESNEEINCTYFDLNECIFLMEKEDKQSLKKMSYFFKIFSPSHLLKEPFINDSNTLNKDFYSELIYIIGLEEVKEGSKKVIKRKSKPFYGSLLENTISKLDSEQLLENFKNIELQESSYEIQLFNIALDLCITWMNRILFLKLVEAQLINYHNGDKNTYGFLNRKKIREFDQINTLFFEVFAKRKDARSSLNQKTYPFLPYLNSTLFETSETEKKTLRISNLKDSLTLPVYSKTILKDNQGKSLNGQSLPTLEYLLRFLDAYDFGSESTDIIQKESKNLISASVLGLIFEKINGYKDGSFFTPGFITMYMSRATIRNCIIEKFNEQYDWKCETFIDLYNHLNLDLVSIKEANEIINNIRICDPAVGSGHFLISALNEIITIKSELKILCDKNLKRLKEYSITVENDELQIMNEDKGELFEYSLNINGKPSPEKQRIQETLFHEKLNIIENCLFGVDINPNSVKICCLRLWIELLKNTYYSQESNFKELQTLPNLDINIKQGHSLLSRFPLDADLTQALKKTGWTQDTYADAVYDYKRTTDRKIKHELEELISKIKNEYKVSISKQDPRYKKLLDIEKKHYFYTEGKLIDIKLKKEDEKKKKKEIENIEKQIEKIKAEFINEENGIPYKDAFEWRFEFPEILDSDANYKGFDMIIGNPPYGVSIKGHMRDLITQKLEKVPDFEIYYWFLELSYKLIKKSGVLSLIIPNSILFNVFAKNYRLNLINKFRIEEILDCTDIKIFEDASVRNVIMILSKQSGSKIFGYKNTKNLLSFEDFKNRELVYDDIDLLKKKNRNWSLVFKIDKNILDLTDKMESYGIKIIDYFPEISQGLIAYDQYRGQTKETIELRAFHAFDKVNKNYKPWLWGEDVKRYIVKWNQKEYINYCSEIANPREPKFFKGRRLLIREITNPSIFVAYTEEELYNDPAIIVIKDTLKKESNKISILFILGILNSRLATFYHFNSSPKAIKGEFPKILVDDIKVFPLPKYNKLEHDEMDGIVKKIFKLQNDYHNIKNENEKIKKQIDILDNKIDQMIYKLYDLTPEEIKIVEGSL